MKRPLPFKLELFCYSTLIFALAHSNASHAASANKLLAALKESSFTSADRLQALPEEIGVYYNPMLATVAASINSRAPQRNGNWEPIELPALGIASGCSKSLEAHLKRSRTNSQYTFVIFPGSFAQFKMGGYTNLTSSVLENLFPDPNIIAFSGFQSAQFLKGRCNGVLWNMRELGRDLYYRLANALQHRGLSGAKQGLLGFSGGGTLVLEIAAEDSRVGRETGKTLFNMGAMAFSPILHGPVAFLLLDTQHQSSKIPKSEGLTTITWRTFSRLIGHLLLKGTNAAGIVHAYKLRPDEFVQRSYNEFTVSFLKGALSASGIYSFEIGKNLSYTWAFMQRGFQREIPVPDSQLHSAFAKATDITPALQAIRAPVLIHFSKDDPILSAPPGQPQPWEITRLLSTAGKNPYITVFNPDFGGHAAATLDPAFPGIVAAFFEAR